MVVSHMTLVGFDTLFEALSFFSACAKFCDSCDSAGAGYCDTNGCQAGYIRDLNNRCVGSMFHLFNV